MTGISVTYETAMRALVVGTLIWAGVIWWLTAGND